MNDHLIVIMRATLDQLIALVDHLEGLPLEGRALHRVQDPESFEQVAAALEQAH